MSQAISKEKLDYPKLDKVFVTGLYIYAIGSHLGKSFISVGIGLVLLTWLIKVILYQDFTLNKSVKNWPIFALAGIMIFSRNDFWNVLTSGHVYSVILPLAILNQLEDKKLIYKILGVSLGVLAISGVVADYQYFVEGMRRAEGLARHSITSANVSVMGVALLLPFLFRKSNKLFHYFIISITIIIYSTAVLFSMTRAAYFGLIIVLFLFTLIKKPKIIPVILIILVIAFNFLPTNFQNRFNSSFNFENNWIHSRLEIWGFAFEAGLKNPVRGIGYSEFNEYVVENFPDRRNNWAHAHNIFISFFAEIGLIGFIIFLYLSFYLLKVFYSSYLKISEEDSLDRELFLGTFLVVVAFLVMSLTDYNMADTQIRNFFWVIVGLGFSLKYLIFDK